MMMISMMKRKSMTLLHDPSEVVRLWGKEMARKRRRRHTLSISETIQLYHLIWESSDDIWRSANVRFALLGTKSVQQPAAAFKGHFRHLGLKPTSQVKSTAKTHCNTLLSGFCVEPEELQCKVHFKSIVETHIMLKNNICNNTCQIAPMSLESAICHFCQTLWKVYWMRSSSQHNLSHVMDNIKRGVVTVISELNISERYRLDQMIPNNFHCHQTNMISYTLWNSAFYVRLSCRAKGGGGGGWGVGWWWWVTQERHIDPSKQASQGGFNACVICSLARVGLGKGWFGTRLREGISEKIFLTWDISTQASKQARGGFNACVITWKQPHLSIGKGRSRQGVIWNLMEG